MKLKTMLGLHSLANALFEIKIKTYIVLLLMHFNCILMHLKRIL